MEVYGNLDEGPLLSQYDVKLFDVDDREGRAALHRTSSTRGGRSDGEVMDNDHRALILHTRVSRLAR